MMYAVWLPLTPVCRLPCEKARAAVDLSAARENVKCDLGFVALRVCVPSPSRLYGDGKSNENLFHVWCT